MHPNCIKHLLSQDPLPTYQVLACEFAHTGQSWVINSLILALKWAASPPLPPDFPPTAATAHSRALASVRFECSPSHPLPTNRLHATNIHPSPLYARCGAGARGAAVKKPDKTFTL